MAHTPLETRLLKVIAQAALCIIENPQGAIVDTLWLDEHLKFTPTLYEHLCCELTDMIEFNGDVEDDKVKLRELIGRM